MGQEAGNEDDAPDVVRKPDEVARRALGLFAAVSLGFRADRQAVLEWLTEEKLWDALSPIEKAFVDTASPSEKQMINASWWSERLIVLLWALKLADALPPPNEQFKESFLDLLPPFSGVSVSQFIRDAKLRPNKELRDMQAKILRFHWQARDDRLHGRTRYPTVDMEIIQERHHAINWVIGYEGLAWDDVTADT